MNTLLDAPPRALLPLFGEGWTGSGSCSDCYANHRSGSRNCGCACHTRWALAPAMQPAAVQMGLSPDCGTGCHAPLCDGRNCSCSCHASYALTGTQSAAGPRASAPDDDVDWTPQLPNWDDLDADDIDFPDDEARADEPVLTPPPNPARPPKGSKS